MSPVKRKGGALGADPTRTGTMRRAFTAKLRRRYINLRAAVRALLIRDDAFGLLRKRIITNAGTQTRDKVEPTTNTFCPTGEGGGVDPSCSPGGSGSGRVRAVSPFDQETLKKYASELADRMGEFEDNGKDDSHEWRAMFHMSGALAGVPQGHQVAVVETDGKLVAAGGMKLSGTGGNRTAYVTEIGSLEKGGGTKVLTKLVTTARELGVKTITADASKEAIGLNKKLGFTVTGPPNENGTPMSLKLNILTTNAPKERFAFRTTAEQVDAFADWLRENIDSELDDDALWEEYAKRGFKQGAGRAFDDANKRLRGLTTGDRGDFLAAGRDTFLRSAFGRPEATAKIKLLAGRSFTDLRNVNTDMATRMRRTLTDGLTQGKSPYAIADDLDDDLNLGRARAETIARTEIIRAHAEGQLDAFGALGVEEVGAAVEFKSTEDERVCPACSHLEGVVLSLAEARNVIPIHPGCRCCWTPANVGEDPEFQTRTKRDIEDAFGKAGIDKTVAKTRPESVLNADLRAWERLGRNVFCPTGEGGGVDPTCSPGEGDTGQPSGGSGSGPAIRVLPSPLPDREYASEFEASGRKYTFAADRPSAQVSHWDVQFANDRDEIRLTGDTGASAVAVMRAAGAALDRFVSDRQPDSFTFSADGDEPSRVRLYDRAARTIAARHGYTHDREEKHGLVKYTFRRGSSPATNTVTRTFADDFDAAEDRP